MGFNVLINGDQVPIQPGFKIKKNYIEKVEEWNPVTENAAAYYQFSTDKGEANIVHTIPDACIDIMFCIDPSNPSGSFFGKRTTSSIITLKPGCVYFGFRPYSEKGLKKLKYDLNEIHNEEIPITQILNGSGDLIIERLLKADSFEKRIEVFQGFLKEELIDFDYSANLSNDIAVYCNKVICLSKGKYKINNLNKKTGYSARYIRKTFHDSFGISPKHFGQIIRFQRAVHLLMECPDYDLVDIVYESGFYDQAHFNKEFKNLCSLTPSKFISEIRKHA